LGVSRLSLFPFPVFRSAWSEADQPEARPLLSVLAFHRMSLACRAPPSLLSGPPPRAQLAWRSKGPAAARSRAGPMRGTRQSGRSCSSPQAIAAWDCAQALASFDCRTAQAKDEGRLGASLPTAGVAFASRR
jgi:hypothetical protein